MQHPGGKSRCVSHSSIQVREGAASRSVREGAASGRGTHQRIRKGGHLVVGLELHRSISRGRVM